MQMRIISPQLFSQLRINHVTTNQQSSGKILSARRASWSPLELKSCHFNFAT